MKFLNKSYNVVEIIRKICLQNAFRKHIKKSSRAKKTVKIFSEIGMREK